MTESAYLVLGCFGRTESEFVLCSSVENKILKLDDTLFNFHDIAGYLDKLNLFEKILLDQNSIRHLIYNLQDRFDQKTKRLWSDHKYNLIERFMQTHKPCGFYAKTIISIQEKEIEKPIKDEIFLIKAQPEMLRRIK